MKSYPNIYNNFTTNEKKNPWEYYHKLFKAYNVPDFTKTKVEFDVREAQRQLKKDRIQVTIRK